MRRFKDGFRVFGREEETYLNFIFFKIKCNSSKAIEERFLKFLENRNLKRLWCCSLKIGHHYLSTSLPFQREFCTHLLFLSLFQDLWLWVRFFFSFLGFVIVWYMRILLWLSSSNIRYLTFINGHHFLAIARQISY